MCSPRRGPVQHGTVSAAIDLRDAGKAGAKQHIQLRNCGRLLASCVCDDYLRVADGVEVVLAAVMLCSTLVVMLVKSA